MNDLLIKAVGYLLAAGFLLAALLMAALFAKGVYRGCVNVVRSFASPLTWLAIITLFLGGSAAAYFPETSGAIVAAGLSTLFRVVSAAIHSILKVIVNRWL